MSISAVNASMNSQYYTDYQKAHKATAPKATPKHATVVSNKTIDLKV
jgi:hypothetical protein